ncbi:MAG: succinate-semialdehyde dehydrogenase [Cyclobacteriaceae bacterium]|nr:MAG: succinate-semialdehyde dehydrogenase [Cyclobacteriaceae bacterium]
MKLSSINPFNQEVIKTFDTLNQDQLEQKVYKSETAFSAWKKSGYSERSNLLRRVSKNLRTNQENLAKIITMEMGKPVTQSRAEVEKCAWVCEFYAENGQKFLEKERIDTDAKESWVEYQPLGPVLAIMPWNYPLWQVFRFAAPAVMAGNSCLLKHASNVSLCSLNIETIFNEAKAPKGLFQTLLIQSKQVEAVIKHQAIKAVTLTGSEPAGASVAAIAGKNIKKSVLELGGSNAFIVLADADLDIIMEDAVNGRFQNTGQSCIAAKRFILSEKIEKEFIDRFTDRVKSLKVGNPLNEATEVGPMARVDLAEELEGQVKASVKEGAHLLLGGNRDRAHFEPSILTRVEPGMPAFDQELFGPVAAFTTVSGPEEALQLTNNSRFGLGATVCTSDPEKARYFIEGVDDGAVFVNSMVKSDPRLPFGGTKYSGYGRELSSHGIKEFVNIKTVYMK